MAEELQQSTGQNLHHFISVSKWDLFRVMDAVTVSFADQLKRDSLHDDTCMIIDESGIPKKGNILLQ